MPEITTIISVLCTILALIAFTCIVIIPVMGHLNKSNKMMDILINNGHIHFDYSAEEMFDLALNYWRLQKHFAKVAPTLENSDKRRIENALNKMGQFIERNDIKIEDYEGRTYNEGMNVEVLGTNESSFIKEPIISETVEPSIIYKGGLEVKRSKVIITKKQGRRNK